MADCCIINDSVTECCILNDSVTECCILNDSVTCCGIIDVYHCCQDYLSCMGGCKHLFVKIFFGGGDDGGGGCLRLGALEEFLPL